MIHTRFEQLFYVTCRSSFKFLLDIFHAKFIKWINNTNNLTAFEEWKYFILAMYNAGESQISKNVELFALFTDLLISQCQKLPQEMFAPDSFLVAQVNYLIEDMTDTKDETLVTKAQTLVKYLKSRGVDI